MRYLRAPGICLLLLSSLAAPAVSEAEERERSSSGSSASELAPNRAPGQENISANGLSLLGTLTYSYVYVGSSGTMRMTAGEVRNSRSGGTSGTLRLALWATTTIPVFGQTIFANTLGTYTMGQLSGGFSFFNVDSGTVGFTTPPNGTYYITMALQEFVGSQYVYQDFFTFSALQTFGLPCTPSSTALCLSGNRFRVTATWQTSTASGVGTAQALTSDTGYFWFFSSTNVEMIVKVLDACGVNNRKWVFAGGLTNVFVVVTVTDTLTGAVRTYVNPQSTAFLPIQDTGAFATCP